ncbi:gastrula zinc finger protein XlCGF26.1 isoform X1 [Bicyclus anynana]|uniref:Gastrula zinc finger protein XlCGF26.1 isoform X1 n=1 Tax=Bicyclus anynana TaxID=110368 RepID=A0A6J1MW61_BICAN|nr:gastrula zinc finger protein XlCGF26.1 isoform X1 [Bicyclus anynana]
MAAKTWKIEKDLCRCCHAEGTFDNLAEPRTFLEKEEVYTDMLRECLDVDIPPVPGELCAITYTICTACITRLRDACNFKKQVQDCEQRFMTMYYKNAIQGVKPETVVKEELEVSLELQQSEDEILVLKKEEDDDDEDALMDFTNDDDDLSDDFPIKRPTTSTKTRSKAKPKPKPSPVKKEKPPPKKKVEAKPVKEKKGDNDKPYTVTQNEDGTRRFKCEKCERTFNTSTEARNHDMYVHLKMSRPQYCRCHICHVKVNKRERASHMETVHGQAPPTCRACGKKLLSQASLLRHERLCHIRQKHKCDKCDHTSLNENQLKTHKKIHEQEKPFACAVCKKAFKFMKTLTKHMLLHSNARPHVCPVCKRAFVEKATLGCHLTKKHPEVKASVTGEEEPFTVKQNEDGTRSFVCNKCNKCFKNSEHVRGHNMYVHLKVPRPQHIRCQICNMRVSIRERVSHMEKEHGKAAPTCGACGKKFRCRSSLMRHLKLYHMGERNHKCDKCDYASLTAYNLSMHKKKHEEVRPFVCHICKKSYKWKAILKRHMLIHLDIRPHVCPVCGQAFIQKTSLQSHVNRQHPGISLK